jgi:hypothetical protein
MIQKSQFSEGFSVQPRPKRVAQFLRSSFLRLPRHATGGRQVHIDRGFPRVLLNELFWNWVHLHPGGYAVEVKSTGWVQRHQSSLSAGCPTMSLLSLRNQAPLALLRCRQDATRQPVSNPRNCTTNFATAVQPVARDNQSPAPSESSLSINSGQSTVPSSSYNGISTSFPVLRWKIHATSGASGSAPLTPLVVGDHDLAVA